MVLWFLSIDAEEIICIEDIFSKSQKWLMWSGKAAFNFSWLEHKNNIGIFFWEYKFHKIMTVYIYFLIYSGSLYTTWLCQIQFCKPTSSIPNPGQTLIKDMPFPLISALGFNVWADRGRLINSLFSTGIHLCRILFHFSSVDRFLSQQTIICSAWPKLPFSVTSLLDVSKIEASIIGI